MRNGLYVKYKGKDYEATAKEDGTYILRTNDEKSIEEGFSLYKGKVYIKNVRRDETEKISNITSFGEFNDIPVEIINEKDNLYCISRMNGNREDFIKLGMKEVDKGIYQMWVKKSDIKSITEKKIEI